jgi:transposase
MKPPPVRMDVSREEFEGVLARVRERLEEPDYEKLKAAIETLAYLTDLVQDREISLQRLRKILFGASTEKTRDVTPASPNPNPAAEQKQAAEATAEKARPGHGRHAAEAFRGARKVEVAHSTLKPGNACPECQKGKVYLQKEPQVLVRVVGQAPLEATVYRLQKLRCNLCGEVFTAEAPPGVGTEKYDATASSMLALLKYGSGLPFYRLENLQASLEIPLPASTQWEVVAGGAAVIQPALEELIRQAAQGEVLHNDDTPMPVLALEREGEREARDPPERKGIFTSGIVATQAGRRIALFFTGHRHAGENLASVLARRAQELAPPIQMCDALTRNLPKLPAKLEVIVSHCLAHARRRFVEVVANFPAECRYVLETLGKVYGYDAQAREQGMSAEARLQFHQEHSGPVMAELQAWLRAQFAEKKVEPNSGLGEAITYLLKHWEPLTLFLRKAGAPLDNNLCERALKKAILHRKNSLFYKTENGAHVGDLYMSLIHTCELNDANPFDYLTELQNHATELAQHPAAWMPWNYRQALQGAGTSKHPA